MPSKLVLAVRGTVAGHRLGGLEEGGATTPPPPFSNASLSSLCEQRDTCPALAYQQYFSPPSVDEPWSYFLLKILKTLRISS